MNDMVQLINPTNGRPLRADGDRLVDEEGDAFPVVRGVPRICEAGNYAESFGNQWNRFPLTQIDGAGGPREVSERRFFAETQWEPEALKGLDILEVGSGAGRFSRAVLMRTEARLWSIDYSNAVEANWSTNKDVAPDRFNLFQASVYEMPFPDGSFDKVFCLGVLQHTPDFEASVRALVAKAKSGGEIVVDFYPIRGFWTKLHAKYLLRPITKRMSQERLMRHIEGNANWLIWLSLGMRRLKLGVLTRFLPLVDLNTLPRGLSEETRREWVILDTFDMFSPAYDNPQQLREVAAMFERAGADVSFSGWVDNGSGVAAVVRGIKRGAGL